MIQNLPPEILYHIFHYACVDQGATARSLSLTSSYIASVSSRFLFNTLYIPGVDHLERALRRLSPLPPHLRRVYHLFVADRDGQIQPERSLSHLDQNSVHMPSTLLSQFLFLIAPTLRTLTVVIQTGLVSGILERIAGTPLHYLTDLTLSFNYTRIAVYPDSHLLHTSTSANLPRLRYLHIDTCHPLSTNIEPAVALVTSQAPRLTTLHVSDIFLMPGCSAVLARMLGRLPLRAQHGWVLPDDVLDAVARLPFSVREFSLQVHAGPPTIPGEVWLVERMASMDYGDGFILLPPTPKRDYRDWKEEWLARAVRSWPEEV